VRWAVTAFPRSEFFKTTHAFFFLCSHTDYLHSLFLTSSVFCDVTQRWLVVTDVSEQLIIPIFHGQEVHLTSSLSVFPVLAESKVPLSCHFRQLYQPFHCTVVETHSAILVCHVVMLHRLCPDAMAPTHHWGTLPLSVDVKDCTSPLRLSSFRLLTMQYDIQQNTCIFQPVAASSLRRGGITAWCPLCVSLRRYALIFS